jgi:hypothetical protein
MQMTVGYGDIVAHSNEETWFCIFYFFISGCFIYFSISNFELLINNMDLSLMKHLTKVSRFEKYAQYRKLPEDIVTRVKSFYDHQWRLLGGVDEQAVSKYALFFMKIFLRHTDTII